MASVGRSFIHSHTLSFILFQSVFASSAAIAVPRILRDCPSARFSRSSSSNSRSARSNNRRQHTRRQTGGAELCSARVSKSERRRGRSRRRTEANTWPIGNDSSSVRLTVDRSSLYQRSCRGRLAIFDRFEDCRLTRKLSSYRPPSGGEQIWFATTPAAAHVVCAAAAAAGLGDWRCSYARLRRVSQTATR